MSGPFVHPDADLETDDVEVPCPCVGTPHETDTVTIRAALNGYEVSTIQGAVFTMQEGTAVADVSARDRMAMEIGVVGWSFVDGDGNPIPFRKDWIGHLRADIWQVVSEAVDRLTKASSVPLGESASPTTSGSTSPTQPLIFAPGPTHWDPSSSTLSQDSVSGTSTSY